MLKLIPIYLPFSDIEKTVKKHAPDEYKNNNFNVANVTANYNTREIEFDIYLSDSDIENQDRRTQRRYKFDVEKIENNLDEVNNVDA